MSLRDWTQRVGLWPTLRATRSLIGGDVARWLRDGCPSPPPNLVKIRVVESYVRSCGARRFVETGTFFGAMTDAIARMDVFVDTIELDFDLARRARDQFASRKNIRVHQGDSSIVLPKIVSDMHEPAVFWLDAHYSGGITAKGDVDTPISSELEVLLSYRYRHVILIDDARCFTGTNGYPHLHHLLDAIWSTGRYAVEVSTDIIRCVGRERG